MRAPASHRRPRFCPRCQSATIRLYATSPCSARARSAFLIAALVDQRPPSTSPFGLPGPQLQPAELLAGQARLAVGIVLAPGEHAPEQTGELARGGGDRDLVAAADADPSVKGPDRTRVSDRRPRGLDQRMASRGEPAWNSSRPMQWHPTGAPSGRARGRRPACGGSREVPDLPDRRHEAGGGDHVDARHRHQPADLRPNQAPRPAIAPLDPRDLCLAEVDLAKAPVDGFTLLHRQLHRLEPAPALEAEEIGKSWALRSACASAPRGSRSLPWPSQPDQLGAAPQAPAHRPGGLIGHPNRINRATPRPGACASARASRRSVFALAPRISGVGGGGDHHPGDAGVDDSRHLPGVARDLQGDLVVCAEAAGEELQLLRELSRPARSSGISAPSAIATSQKSRWMSRPIDLILITLLILVWESRWTNDSDGFVLEAQPGRSQGRPMKSRALGRSRKDGLSSLRSPEGPCSGGPTLGREPDVSLRWQFHAPKRGSGTGSGMGASLARLEHYRLSLLGFAQGGVLSGAVPLLLFSSEQSSRVR